MVKTYHDVPYVIEKNDREQIRWGVKLPGKSWVYSSWSDFLTESECWRDVKNYIDAHLGLL